MATSSANRVVPAEDADFPALFAILSDCFGHRHPFIECFYPDHDTVAGREAGAKRLLEFSKADPDTHFMKCVNENGTILGFSKWNIWVNAQPSFPDDKLPWTAGTWDPKPWDGLDSELAELARWSLEYYLDLRLRARAASKGNLVVLDLMCISPDHQRRGAGQQLMKWGIEQSDRYGVEAVVESSDEGKGLYEKYGFRSLRHIEIRETSGKWKGKEAQQFYWMIRPLNGQGQISSELLAASKDTKGGTVADSGREH